MGEDAVVQLSAMCLAKKYLIAKDLLIYVYRERATSLTHNPDAAKSIGSFIIMWTSMKKVLDKVHELDNNRLLKEMCFKDSFELISKILVLPCYNSATISPELDNSIYETLLPTFGENTTIVKYLFHYLNIRWQQTNVLTQQVNFLLQHLRQREEELQKQNQLIEQVRNLLEQNNAKN